MIMSSLVSAQVTDAVTQTSTSVLSNSTSVALGMLYQSVAHANGLAMTNATSNQQNLNQLSASIVSKSVSTIFG